MVVRKSTSLLFAESPYIRADALKSTRQKNLWPSSHSVAVGANGVYGQKEGERAPFEGPNHDLILNRGKASS